MPIQSKQLGVILGTVIVLVLGIGVYFIVSNRSQLDTQVQSQNLIVNTEGNSNPQGAPASSQADSSGRVLLTRDILSVDDDLECDDFNEDPANQVITYQNVSRGIAVELPYNENWGNSKYKISPYDEYVGNEAFVDFGPMGPYSEGSCSRNWSINFLPVKTAQERITEIQAMGDEYFTYKPQKVEINGLTVIKYIHTESSSSARFEVIGKKYNYQFSVYHGGEKDFQQLEKIVKSIKLIQ